MVQISDSESRLFDTKTIAYPTSNGLRKTDSLKVEDSTTLKYFERYHTFRHCNLTYPYPTSDVVGFRVQILLCVQGSSSHSKEDEENVALIDKGKNKKSKMGPKGGAKQKGD